MPENYNFKWVYKRFLIIVYWCVLNVMPYLVLNNLYDNVSTQMIEQLQVEPLKKKARSLTKVAKVLKNMTTTCLQNSIDSVKFLDQNVSMQIVNIFAFIHPGLFVLFLFLTLIFFVVFVVVLFILFFKLYSL